MIVKHTNPCGAAERGTLVEAWEAALAGDPVSAFGGVVALNRVVDRPTAEGLAAIFLEVVVAPDFDADAREILAAKANLRLVVDPSLGGAAAALTGHRSDGLDPDGGRRRARHRPRHRARRPRLLAGLHHPPPDRYGVARPPARLAPRSRASPRTRSSSSAMVR